MLARASQIWEWAPRRKILIQRGCGTGRLHIRLHALVNVFVSSFVYLKYRWLSLLYKVITDSTFNPHIYSRTHTYVYTMTAVVML